MRVLELWRYPVKSLQGERVESAVLTADGLEGDRRYAIYDAETGLGLTGRRVPELLFASARFHDDGAVEITTEDGSLLPDDDALSDWLGRRVRLCSTSSDAARRYENVIDFEHEPVSDWELFDGAGGAFHDSAQARVSLVSTGSIGAWDRRRFRANVVLDGEGEDSLVGSRVRLGDAVLEVSKRLERCVMTTRAQPGGIERDLKVLRTLASEREACMAIGAVVAQPGSVRVSETLTTA